MDIDCSHLVYNALKEAGYQVPFMSTSCLHCKAALAYFDIVPVEEARPGDDLILYQGHVGILASYNLSDKTGSFFGSQTRKGPSIASFKEGKSGKGGWGADFIILRPKKELRVGAHINAPRKNKVSRWDTNRWDMPKRWGDRRSDMQQRYLRRWQTGRDRHMS